MSFPGDSSQLVTQEMSDIPLELNSKKQAAENEPTTNVTIKEEYKYDGIEHHYISYECIKQEDCRDNLEDSQQDPLAIEDIGIGNVKREYSLIDHIKQECSTDVLVERKNGDTQTVDLEELEVNCSVDNYISTASTCEDSKQLNTKCNEKKEASSILGKKQDVLSNLKRENDAV